MVPNRGPARPARRSRYLTIMVVPHSSQEPWSIRVPRLAIEVVCAVIGIAGICLLMFTNAYQRMTSHMDELIQLRETTRQQRAQIDDLTERAADVQENLLELEALERQVRQMLDLPRADEKAEEEGDELDLDASRDLFGGVPRAHIAQLQDPLSSRGETHRDDGTTGRPFATVAAVGGPAPNLNEPINLGGIANLTVPQFEPTGEAEANAARIEFIEAREYSAELLDRMQTLREEAADKLAYLAARPSIWPAYGPVTSHFGMRYNPFGSGTEFHAGIDIGAPYGSVILATGDGVVTFSGWDAGYGYKVTIDHGYGMVTVYAHASALLVSPGDHVETGDVIAYVGSSGRSTAPHLHYEVWVNGRLTDPWEFLP